MWDTIIITPFMNVLLLIYNLVGQNFGLAIIFFTLLIKLITHPLIARQVKSTRALSELQKDPAWLDMQKKYKNDKNKLAEAQMALYKERGVSPFSSCLPTLIQLPIIIGLYQAIIQTMGNAPLQLINVVTRISPVLTNLFSFVPWIHNPISLIPLNNHFLWMDLALPERLYIPGLVFNGVSIGIPVLAILVVLSSYIQTKLMGNPSDDPQTRQMSGMMTIYMPLLMGWFAFSFASGLALYFLISNVFSMFEYGLFGKLNLASIFPGNTSNQQKKLKEKNDRVRETKKKEIIKK